MLSRFTRMRGFQVKAGKGLHSIDLRNVLSMFSLASLALRNIASEEDGDGMQFRTGQTTYPMFRLICSSGAQYLCPRRHALLKLFRKGCERFFVHAQSAQAVPCEGQCH